MTMAATGSARWYLLAAAVLAALVASVALAQSSSLTIVGAPSQAVVGQPITLGAVCGSTPVPTGSTGALVGLALALLTAGAFSIRRARIALLGACLLCGWAFWPAPTVAQTSGGCGTVNWLASWTGGSIPGVGDEFSFTPTTLGPHQVDATSDGLSDAVTIDVVECTDADESNCGQCETCSSGSCVPAPGTPCGAGPTACSGQDTCDASGICQPNHLAPGADCGTCRACNGSGACVANSTDHQDCSACSMCSAGSCMAQVPGQDLKNECAPVSQPNCTSYLYGWTSPTSGTCARYAGASGLNGSCNGSGACATSLTELCSGIGTPTYACDSGCRHFCPTGGFASSYDSAAEVCYTDLQPHGCSNESVCDPDGQCVFVGP